MTEIINTKEWKRFLNEVKPERKKPVQRESQLQQAAVRWFRYTYPQYKDLLFSIPNGGHRNKITAARMKAEGQVAGVPDLMLAVPRNGYHGVFIEMKAEKGKLTYSQKEIMKRLFNFNYRICIIRSIEEFQLIINDYLS